MQVAITVENQERIEKYRQAMADKIPAYNPSATAIINNLIESHLSFGKWTFNKPKKSK
jgi:hypothetical protein